MKRIVHGDPADPKSTRDIVGIKPAEYEFLIGLFQGAVIGYELITALGNEYMLESLAEQAGIPISEMKKIKEQSKEEAEKWLIALNQPYPGKEYPIPNLSGVAPPVD